MRTTFHVDFRASLNRGSLGFARLEKDLAFAPTPDIEFENPAWQNTRTAMSVTYNIEEQFFYVILQYDEIDPKSREDHAEMYRGHGWTIYP